jgi:hypothetical protein
VPGVAGAAGCGDLGVAPMPVAVELNGLLPGRGPGRGPGRWPGPDWAGLAGADGRGACAAGLGAACSDGLVSAGGTCGPASLSGGNGTVTAGVAGLTGCSGGSGGATGSTGAAGVLSSAGSATGAGAGGAGARPFADRLEAAGAFAAAPSAAFGCADC